MLRPRRGLRRSQVQEARHRKLTIHPPPIYIFTVPHFRRANQFNYLFVKQKALAKANGIPLIEIESRTELGEWLGHCKYDKEGAPRKVKATSSIAITNYGEESEDLSFVQNYIKENKC